MWEPRPSQCCLYCINLQSPDESFLNDGKTLLHCITEYSLRACHRKQRCSTRKDTTLTFPNLVPNPREWCSGIKLARMSPNGQCLCLLLSLVERIPLTNLGESTEGLKESVVYLLVNKDFMYSVDYASQPSGNIVCGACWNAKPIKVSSMTLWTWSAER